MALVTPTNVAAPAPASGAGAGASPQSMAAARPGLHSALAKVLLLSAAGLVALVLCLAVGAQPISWGEMVRAIRASLAGQDAGATGVILYQIRLPRVLLSALVGGTLAVIGVVLQALLRNPLADPFVLGISSGAALGAGLAILLGAGTTLWVFSSLPLFAFAGGLFAFGLLYRMARSEDRLPVTVLLLAGVILNAVFSACLMFLTSIMEPSRSFGMLTWLMGTLTAPTYQALGMLALYFIVGCVALARLAGPFNLLSMGEQTARSLGLDVEQVKRRAFVVTALLTGAVVSISGMIGFIGMLIPHAVRMVIGPDHRVLLPASCAAGAIFLMAADTVSRTIMAPVEIPVGIVTALGGGPFFLYLLMSRKRVFVQ